MSINFVTRLFLGCLGLLILNSAYGQSTDRNLVQLEAEKAKKGEALAKIAKEHKEFEKKIDELKKQGAAIKKKLKKEKRDLSKIEAKIYKHKKRLGLIPPPESVIKLQPSFDKVSSSAEIDRSISDLKLQEKAILKEIKELSEQLKVKKKENAKDLKELKGVQNSARKTAKEKVQKLIDLKKLHRLKNGKLADIRYAIDLLAKRKKVSK